MGTHTLLLLTAGLLVAAGDAQEDAIKKDRQALQGTWQLTVYEVDGNKPLPDDQLGIIKAIFDASGKLTVQADGNTVVESVTKIDPAKKPKTIDFTFTEGEQKGEMAQGIYELKGDTLRYCRAVPGKDRPTEFASKPGTGHVLAVYKREKPQ
jgi:uncharacterized protein (TIGR03067 family)